MASLGEALRNTARGVVSILTTGSWKVEEYADKLQDAETKLDRVDKEAEQDAHFMLDKINDLMTNRNITFSKTEDARKGVAIWGEKARVAKEEAMKHDPGTPERIKLEELVKKALTEKVRFEDKLVPLEEALAESDEDYQEALKMIEEIGFTKEEILSERDRLDATRLKSEVKSNLAAAKRGGGDLKAKKLLNEAREQVRTIEAEADAEEAIADKLPADTAQVDAELSIMTRNKRIEDEFAKLMGEQS